MVNNLYALIPIVVISREDAPITGSTGAAQQIRTTDLLKQLEEEKKKIFQSRQKTNTQYNMVPPIKQIVCTSTGEGGETLLKL